MTQTTNIVVMLFNLAITDYLWRTEEQQKANSAIAEENLEKERLSNNALTIEQIQDGRIGSIVLETLPDLETATLSFFYALKTFLWKV